MQITKLAPIVTFCLMCQISLSQFNKGTVSFGIESLFLEKQSAVIDNLDEFGNTQSTQQTFGASAGLFIAQNIQIGIIANSVKSENFAFYQDQGFTVRLTENKSAFSIGPSLGYYIFLSKRLFIPFSADLSYQWLDTDFYASIVDTRVEEAERKLEFDFKEFQYRLNTGLEFLFTKNIAGRIIVSYNNKDAFRAEMSSFKFGIGITSYFNRNVSFKDPN